MDAYPPAPLVSRDLPHNHPLVTMDYSLFTPPIQHMVESLAGWIDDRFNGAVIYGPSRFGKSSAVNHWLQSLLADRYGGYVPLVIWSHTAESANQSVGTFYMHLLEASRHPLARAARGIPARLEMLVQRWTQLAAQGGGRFMVLVIDEVQSMTDREWQWLVQLHSRLEQEHVRLCVFCVASVQFFDEPIGLALSGGAHVAARFMLATERFRGVCGLDELAFVMSGYDHATEWPPGSGQSFTAGIAPRAWAEGFRMEAHAPALLQAMLDELPSRYQSPHEFPMQTIAMSCRHVLLRIAGGADWRDVTRPQSMRSIVAGCGHKTLMALVSAVAPRLSKRRGPG